MKHKHNYFEGVVSPEEPRKRAGLERLAQNPLDSRMSRNADWLYSVLWGKSTLVSLPLFLFYL